MLPSAWTVSWGSRKSSGPGLAKQGQGRDKAPVGSPCTRCHQEPGRRGAVRKARLSRTQSCPQETRRCGNVCSRTWCHRLG